ncbi:MAG: hypothetical protein ACR2J8_05670 [Thermomicrobiales bacterium]
MAMNVYARRMAGITGLALMAAMFATPLGALADEAQRDQIAEETAAIRELPALPEIDDQLITSDELKAMLPDLLTKDYSPEQALADQRGLIAIGLLPPGTDLMAMQETLLGEQVAGFWDPDTDEMYVIDDSGEFDAMAQMTYSHETVHALQDANLGLDDAMAESGVINSDAATAAAALYEGDASAASFEFLAAHPELARKMVFSASGSSEELDSSPAAVSISLVFPYLAGEKFVSALRAEGGWDAVNAAYTNLPQSTEQIMHPEKYLVGEQPVDVSAPDPTGALGSGWTPVVDDTMGELGIAVLLANLPPGKGINNFTGAIDLPVPALNAAAGWGGDRYALWENGDRDLLVWDTAWDTDRDAGAFLRALAQHQQDRFGGLFEGESGNDIAMVTDDVAIRLRQDGARVTMVQGPDVATVDAALAAVQAAPGA